MKIRIPLCMMLLGVFSAAAEPIEVSPGAIKTTPEVSALIQAPNGTGIAGIMLPAPPRAVSTQPPAVGVPVSAPQPPAPPVGAPFPSAGTPSPVCAPSATAPRHAVPYRSPVMHEVPEWPYQGSRLR